MSTENPMSTQKRRWPRKRWLWLLLIPLLAVVGFVGWASLAAQPTAHATAALQSDGQVNVTTTSQGWLLFEPANGQSDTGLIFYPGAKVDPRAYASEAHAIAAQGNTVVIVPMLLNLAVLSADRATEVIAVYPEIETWAIGGHSLGGAMAAQYAYNHPDTIDGLALWAAYPPDANDLSDTNLPVLSISGTNDGLATPAKIEATRHLLPDSTTFVTLQGGNHAQFGSYGPQDGDQPATISPEDQHQQIVTATGQLLLSLK
jgi:poly(3-hydroxybutyrate) depolymerase